MKKCKPVGAVDGVEFEVSRFDELDAYTYSQSDQLDTDNLSAPTVAKDSARPNATFDGRAAG